MGQFKHSVSGRKKIQQSVLQTDNVPLKTTKQHLLSKPLATKHMLCTQCVSTRLPSLGVFQALAMLYWAPLVNH